MRKHGNNLDTLWCKLWKSAENPTRVSFIGAHRNGYIYSSKLRKVSPSFPEIRFLSIFELETETR